MDVFDSNIWIYGLTGECADAVALVEEAVDTTFHVGVSAYIYDEVMRNLKRSDHSQEMIDRAQTRFADIVYGNHTVHGPNKEQIRQMDIDAHRSDPRVQTMGDAFGIQDKDVPVVVYAYQVTRRRGAVTTTIHTADRAFSEFDPNTHFENLSLRYVDCSG